MISFRRNVVAPVLCLCLGLSAAASAHETDESATLIAAAEQALGDGDYRQGVTDYVAAATAGDSLETARQAALMAYEFGFDALAVSAAERWAALADDTTEADQMRAYALLRVGDVKASREQMATLLSAADDAEPICEHAAKNVGRGVNTADVAALFAALARQFDETPCVIRIAASAALADNDDAASDNYLRRLRKLDGFDNKARLIEMARLVRLDKADEALTDPELRLDASATLEQRIELAFLNAQAEQVENGLNMLGLLRLESPEDPDAMLAEAMLQLRAGDIPASRRSLLNLLASGNKTGDALYYLARFAERERRVDQALRLYSQVEYGDLVIAAQQRASQLISQRDGLDAGIEHLQAFVKRHPRYGLSLSTVLAAAYTEGEQYERALATYDAYLEIRPRAEFALLARANVLLEADRLDDAIEAFRDVVDAFPESANALNALGYTLADRTRKFREAEKLIDKALEKEPDNPAIIDSKGWVLFRRGKLEEAHEYLARAWEEFQDPEVAAHLGETLWRLGREDESRELLQDAWQRFPNDERLRDTIERLLENGPATRS